MLAGAVVGRNLSIFNCGFREIVRHGDTVGEILDAAKELNSDLIVMGVEHKLFDDKTFGENTYEMLRSAPCPVITVPRTSGVQSDPTVELPRDR